MKVSATSNSPRVTIVVLNRNRCDDLIECLETLFRNSYRCSDVILVDNASEDRSLETVRNWAARSPKPIPWREFDVDPTGGLHPVGSGEVTEEVHAPPLTIVRARTNLGYAAGHNLGIRLALERDVQYVFLLNSDVVVDPDFLQPLVDAAEAAGVGACGPLVLTYSAKDVVWQAGAKVYTRLGWVKPLGMGQSREAFGNDPLERDSLLGCALLLKTETVKQVGLFDSDYFLYLEETDWLVRARKSRWKVMLVPASRVWHKETFLSTQAKSVYSSYYFARNRLVLTRKNTASCLPFALAWNLGYTIVSNVLRRRWWHLGMSLWGIWDFVRGKTGRCDALSHSAGPIPNVLVFSTDYKPRLGGIAEHTYKVACHLMTTGASVRVLAPRWGDYRRFDRGQPFPTHRVLQVPILDWLFYSVYAFYLILRYRIGVVYVATFNPCGLICRMLKFLIHFSFTVTIHGHEVVYSAKGARQRVKAVLKPLQAAAIGSADKVFAVSEFTKRSLVASGVDATKIATIFNGVDLGDFENITEVEPTVERLGVAGKRIILTIARLDVHKGHDVVIRALPSILTRVPDAVYVVVGEGTMWSHLHDLSCTCGVNDQVVFTGLLQRRDVLALLKACDVFVMISRIEGSSAEGFGIVFLEAGALRKPVVGGRSGGIPDAVEEGVTGFLVKPDSPEEVAEAVTRVLLDRQLASNLGRAGYDRVRSRFTWDKIVARIIDGMGTIGSRQT